MVDHLYRAVVEHVGELAGFQEVDDRLTGWEAAWKKAHEDGLPDWAEAALGDERRRALLVRVVQALVRERVGVRDLEPIIEAFGKIDPERGPRDAVESVRAQLSPEALGLREDANVVEVPGDLEAAVADGVRRDDGKTFLALPTLEADELIAGFRKVVEDMPDSVLVVRNPQLRRHVRRVLEREHPAVPLLARSELGGPRWRRRLRTVRS
jgi:flagellar biosynthesis component FlhA